jgi:hypothetical protein
LSWAHSSRAPEKIYHRWRLQGRAPKEPNHNGCCPFSNGGWDLVSALSCVSPSSQTQKLLRISQNHSSLSGQPCQRLSMRVVRKKCIMAFLRVVHEKMYYSFFHHTLSVPSSFFLLLLWLAFYFSNGCPLHSTETKRKCLRARSGPAEIKVNFHTSVEI